MNPETTLTGDNQKESVIIEAPLVQSSSRPPMNPGSDVILGRDESGDQQAMVGTYSIPPGAETPSFRFSRYLSPTVLKWAFA